MATLRTGTATLRPACSFLSSTIDQVRRMFRFMAMALTCLTGARYSLPVCLTICQLGFEHHEHHERQRPGGPVLGNDTERGVRRSVSHLVRHPPHPGPRGMRGVCQRAAL